MFGRKRRDFKYVFPGQNRSNIRHNRLVLKWCLCLGLVVSGLLALLLWVLSQPSVRLR